MLTTHDKKAIIDWIADESQSKGILEDGDVDWDVVTRTEIEDFIYECGVVLHAHINAA